ncbi:MAG TPA: PAN domain-containing protein [Caulobacterales bacterium]|nr:PAN domain-containing protein [Caulobacterales bacterium]
MRTALMFGLATAVFAIGFAAAAANAPVGQPDTALPGGVYTTLTTADDAACAQACSQDRMCMAWTYRRDACELKAVVPEAVAEAGAISGVSRDAPDFARQRVAAAAAPEKPGVVTLAARTTPPAVADQAGPDDLLGGPTSDGDLRPRLGEQAAER